MRAILVPVADRPECKTALTQAFQLADILSANVIGCHLRPSRTESEKLRKGHYLLQFARTARAASSEAGKDSDLKSKPARVLFERLAADHDFQLRKQPRLGGDPSAIWREMVGSLDKLFPIVGPVADMSIVSRPKVSSRGRSAEFMLSAVMHTGKPALVLPQTGVRTLGRRVLIAWNQSVAAARAVSAALPIIAGAESVLICSCGPESRLGPKSAQLAQYLTMWGIKSKRVTTKGRDVEKEIEEIYEQNSSDLVVMGACSRSRVRELVFGGLTQHMLFDSKIPVLVNHTQ